jgi:DNA polymerase V
LIANALNLFIETNLFKEKGLYANSLTVKINPTDSTRELITYALRLLNAIYKPGHGYRKTGVILLGLQPVAGETRRLFHDDLYMKDRGLMGVIDALNERHGRQTVRFGMPIKREVNWKMSRNFLSPGYTTNINEVLQINM